MLSNDPFYGQQNQYGTATYGEPYVEMKSPE
jgi:hypothetical protein